MDSSRPMLIDGEWVTTGTTLVVTDPQDGRLLALVPRGRVADVRQAVDAATRAVWTDQPLTARERARVLRVAGDRVHAESESFARTIAAEGVKTIREARQEAARCATTLRLAAQEAERLGGETIPFDAFPGGEHRVGYWTRDPVGVIAAITPFNDPLNLVAHKIAPALAAGNAVIVKPHELTPLSALRLAEVLVAAGLPPGLLQVVTGLGNVVGAALVRDPGVHMVSFTGGQAAGEHVARAAGTKKLAMELGGNAATIVHADADLDVAVPAIVRGAFSAAGQNCLHVQRVLAHHTVYDELAERLVSAAQALRLGDKLDETTDIGPMISHHAANRVTELIEDARQHGATVLSGNVRKVNTITPTLLDRVPDTHSLARDEVFGPVTILRPVTTLAEAVTIANDHTGLQSAIFTRSLDAAYFAVRRLRAGGVIVNDSTDFRVDAMPFGGRPGSGIGREGVRHAVEAMTEHKVVCINVSSDPDTLS